MKYLFDSYSLVEYLEGTKLGEKVAELIDKDENEVLISVISLAEILSKILRQNRDFIKTRKILFSIGRIVNIDSEIAEEAAKIHSKIKKEKRDFGLADAIIFASAKKNNAQLVTGDMHFKKVSGVIFLE